MLDAATATVASLDLSRVQVVAGAEVLRFASVPANSQITSPNTVMIVSGDDAPIDFSKLKWTVDMTRSVAEARRKPLTCSRPKPLYSRRFQPVGQHLSIA